ncbi:thioredoxin family protein [Pedobacter antarcticus]|uniref:TlpA family protein disulfide reductase n=1 Tax=Pedobacter antarcticus TaxID=34086 RepID=UPI00292DC5DB|nr:thioredoxin family protein [Pedobacter antarcticus]
MGTNSKNIKGRSLMLVVFTMFLLNMPEVQGQNALKKGEYLPDMKIKKIYNASKSEIDLSGGKSKLILFDFWSPDCTGCLLSFPKLDSLQKLFGDDIRIVLVNKQNRDSTERFFEQRKFLYKPNLAFVTGDTLLNRLFPNLAKPAYAWLDGDGKFYQMSNVLTADGIRNFISQQETGFDDYRAKRIYLSSLFDPAYDNNLLSFSYLAKAVPGVNLNDAVGERGISSANSTILDLYRKAYGEQGKYDLKKRWRVELLVDDSSRFEIPDNYDLAYAWRKENLYTYSLLLPEGKASERYNLMQKDLDRYFGITSKIEKRMVRCMTLIRTSTKDKLKSKHNLKGIDIEPFSFFMAYERTSKFYSKRKLVNRPYQMFSDILKGWAELKMQKPFIDQTGYIGNIDISLDGAVVDRFDMIEIRNALNVYDLDIVERDCLIDVLVLREVK